MINNYLYDRSLLIASKFNKQALKDIAIAHNDVNVILSILRNSFLFEFSMLSREYWLVLMAGQLLQP